MHVQTKKSVFNLRKRTVPSSYARIGRGDVLPRHFFSSVNKLVTFRASAIGEAEDLSCGYNFLLTSRIANSPVFTREVKKS